MARPLLWAGAMWIAVHASVATAADAKGNFAVRGVGGQACERMVEFIGSKEEQTRRDAILIYESWFNGYLSHVNRSAQGVFDASPVLESRDMLALLLRQCQRQPKALIETIAAGVIQALSPAGLKSASDVVSVADGQRTRTYRKDTIVRVQQRLVELGHLKGKADGKLGPASTTAIEKFQESQKLDATGFLDMDTLLRILLS